MIHMDSVVQLCVAVVSEDITLVSSLGLLKEIMPNPIYLSQLYSSLHIPSR
jgi:hypothetical protein